jgi:hypothetical protein
MPPIHTTASGGREVPLQAQPLALAACCLNQPRDHGVTRQEIVPFMYRIWKRKMAVANSRKAQGKSDGLNDKHPETLDFQRVSAGF